MPLTISWIGILLIPLLIFLGIFIYRRSYKNKTEVRQQLAAASLALGIAAVAEYIGVSMNLWHYTGGDWPALLWAAYFAVGLAGYQMIKLISEKMQ